MTKIVIAGPPHSGKSVFLGGLKLLLPPERVWYFRACPDGEGFWTWVSPDASQYRRKGTFTSEIVDWYISSINRINNAADIVLIDIGGRTSAENRRILVEGGVEYAIIISGDLALIPEWAEFLTSCGVKIIATIHSDYHATSDDVNSAPMRCHYLERGVDVSSRPVIQKIATMLLDMVAPKRKEDTMDNYINIQALANQLGKVPVGKTLPDGKVIRTIEWCGRDLANIARLLHNQVHDKDVPVKIDGAAPAWLVVAIAHEIHPGLPEINSPNGYVLAVCNKPGDIPAGNNLEWTVKDTQDGWVLVTVQQQNPSVPLDPADLSNWTPPMVPFGSKIILSGRMPNWGMAAIAMAYHGIAKAVAMFQPGIGATVSWTHDANIKLGDLINIK